MTSFTHLLRRSVSLVILGSCLFILLALHSCKEEPKEDPEPATVIIEGFEPTKGAPGATVVITGQNFSVLPDGNEVDFNGVAAVITSATATSITTKVPATATTGKIHLIADKKNVTSVADFIVILPPTITSFSPANGPIGTLVTIVGKNYSLIPEQNKITIGGVQQAVSDPTTNSIKITIAEGTATGKIRIETNLFNVTSTQDFVVTPLIETFEPRGGPIGTPVTIIGSGFIPTLTGNVVKFGTITATVTEATSTSIKVTVPPGAPAASKISVITGSHSTESRSEFAVSE